ncbi:MAG: hypothetical protein OEZ22_06975 [Spirochaetia bacterium]|nr:hypothetical protein [Spirochaetia bacterium]
MKLKAGIIIFASWLSIVVIGTLVFIKQNNPYDIDALKNRVSEIVKEEENSDKILDKLSTVFDLEPALLALILTNNNDYVIGSMYESSRLSKGDYKDFVNNLKNINQKSEWKNYKCVKFKLVSEKNKIYLLVKKEGTFKNNFWDFIKKYSILKWGMASVVLTGAFLILMIIYNILNSSKLKEEKLEEYFIQDKKKREYQNFTKNDREVAATVEFDNSFKRFHQNQLINFIELVQKKYSFQKISFYSRENDTWRSVIQKRGEIFVKGESITIPAFLEEYGEPENWNAPIVLENGKEVYIPVIYKDILTGVFCFVFFDTNFSLSDTIDEIEKKVSGFAKTIFIQKIYEKAVSDEETGFYTYPYFYFLLKERIKADGFLSAIAFHLEDINDLKELLALKKWGRDILSLLMRNQLESAAVGRINNNRFIALFDSKSHIDKQTFIYKLENIVKDMRKITEKSLTTDISLYGCVISEEVKIKNPEHFLSKINDALNYAVEKKVTGYIINKIGFSKI